MMDPSDAVLVNQARLGAFDFIVIALYLLIVAGVGIWAKLTAPSDGENAYFLAGRSMNWIVVSLALFATLFSSVSFVAVPSEIYQYGMALFLVSIFLPFTAPLGVKLFLRFFFNQPTMTAYEYLERRFDLVTRLLGSSLFLIVRTLYAAVVFFAAAVLLETLTGWPGIWTVIGVGIFTTLYTAFGGMRAVLFTDALQAVVLVLGLCAIVWRILGETGATPLELYVHASEAGRGFEVLATPEFWRLDLHDRFNGWLMLIALVTVPMITLSSDQLVIQRLLTSKNYAQARRATYVNYWLNIPLGIPSFLIGWGLLYFYDRFPEKVPAGMAPDNLMALFIGSELPSPLPGLLVAGLLAALMSTVSSVLNSLATVTYHDFLVRLGITTPGGPNELRHCQLLSVAAGVVSVVIGCALLGAGQAVTTTVMETAGLWSSLTSIIFAAFLLGVLVPRVSAFAMKVGLFGGGALTLLLPLFLYYPVPPAERISFAWLWIPGFLFAVVVPLLVCAHTPNRRSVHQMTVWSLPEDSSSKNIDI